MSLEIFLRTGKTGVKNAKVDSFGNFSGNPLDPYVSSSQFNPIEYGITTGSLIKNLNTGNTAFVTGFIVGTFIIILDTQIFTSTDEVFQFEVDDSLSDSEYTKLDLYEDETIELTQRIKDYKDISKVFADFTKSFKIPCSKTNNRSFGNFYNNEITDAFDARFKEEASISINGVRFKEGFISLLGTSMVQGSPSSYNISFTSAGSSLKSILGDDRLSDLEYLDVFNHPIVFSGIKNKFIGGSYVNYDSNGFPLSIFDAGENNTISQSSDLFGDMIYPLISSKSRYFVDSSQSSVSNTDNRNLFYSSSNPSNTGVNIYDLSPSIKIIHLIRAIEFKYNIKFSESGLSGYDYDSDLSFFKHKLEDLDIILSSGNQGTVEYVRANKIMQSIYIYCSRRSGRSEEESVSRVKKFDLSNFVSTGGSTAIVDGNKLKLVSNKNPTRFRNGYNLKFRVDIGSSEAPYSVSIKQDGVERFNSGQVTRSQNFSFLTRIGYPTGFFNRSGNVKKVGMSIEISSRDFISSVNIENIQIEQYSYTDPIFSSENKSLQQTFNYNDLGSFNLNDFADFRDKNAPNMKCIDFLKELFKLFNLVAYFENGIIKVYNYEDYLSLGKSIDISKYVDSNSYSIDRSDVYSEVSYKFNDIKTVTGVKYKDSTGEDYGSEFFRSSDDNRFDGGKYEVKSKFDKMLYETIYDTEDDIEDFFGYIDGGTGIRWGYAVNESFSPIKVSNLLHFARKSLLTYFSSTSQKDISVSDGGSNTFLTQEFTSCFLSPTNLADTSLRGAVNLDFGVESSNEPFVQQTTIFKEYHEKQILRIYDPRSRIIKIDAYIPISVFRDIKLNDTIIINGKSHLINTMKSNLNSDKTTFELILL